MTIQTQNSDGKILRNIGGEILKTPPLFSLSSERGITKDGGNLVSAWKDENRPVKFRAPIGKEPIENGDGIEFDGRTNGQYIPLGYTNEIDWSKDYTMEMWFKPMPLDTDRSIFVGFRNWALGTPEYFLFYTKDNSLFYLLHRTISVNQISKSFSGVNIGSRNHILISMVNKSTVGSSGARLSVMLNGVIVQDGYNIPISNLGSNSVPRNLGATVGRDNFSAKGSIYEFKWVNYGIEKYQTRYPDNTRQHYIGTQVFTPPTFPNTIL